MWWQCDTDLILTNGASSYQLQNYVSQVRFSANSVMYLLSLIMIKLIQLTCVRSLDSTLNLSLYSS